MIDNCIYILTIYLILGAYLSNFFISPILSSIEAIFLFRNFNDTSFISFSNSRKIMNHLQYKRPTLHSSYEELKFVNYPNHEQQVEDPIENQAQKRFIVENQQLKCDLQLVQGDFQKIIKEHTYLL